MTYIEYKMDGHGQTFDRFIICAFISKFSLQCEKKVMEIVEDTGHPTRKCPMPPSFTHGLIKLTVTTVNNSVGGKSGHKWGKNNLVI